jgi:hypothetical protein
MHKAETLHDHFGSSKLLPLRTCSLRADDSLIVSRNWFEMADERSSFCMLLYNRKFQFFPYRQISRRSKRTFIVLRVAGSCDTCKYT